MILSTFREKVYLKQKEGWQENFLKVGMVEHHLPEEAMQGVDEAGLQIFFISVMRFYAERIHE